MTQTLETLAERLTRLEKVVAEITVQLSQFVDASVLTTSKPRKTGDARIPNYYITDNQAEAEALQRMREHLGIADIQLMPLQALRESIVQSGIHPETNEFSRAIIEEREK